MRFFIRFKAFIVASVVTALCIVPAFADAYNCILYSYHEDSQPLVMGVRSSGLSLVSEGVGVSADSSVSSGDLGYILTSLRYGHFAYYYFIYEIADESTYLNINFAYKGPVRVFFVQSTDFPTFDINVLGTGIVLSADDPRYFTADLGVDSGSNYIMVVFRTASVAEFSLPRIMAYNNTSPMDSFLGSISSVPSSVLDIVMRVCSKITSEPILLLTMGIFLLGVCVAIFGRILKKS